jgi:hypothetical protein
LLVIGGYEFYPSTVSMELTIGSKTLAMTFFVTETHGHFSLSLVVIGFMQINVFLVHCINF